MYTCELSIKSEWSIKRIIVAIKTKQMTKHQKCFCNHSGHMFIFFLLKPLFNLKKNASFCNLPSVLFEQTATL